MLVLSRRPGESITLQVGGETIRVDVVETRTGRAAIGIHASQQVVVVRSELLKRARCATGQDAGRSDAPPQQEL